VGANLARNVGPLFGLHAVDTPHGRSWICDYDRLTLKEIGRGAPTPPKGADEWNRGIPDPLPGLTSTALNNFGPDTKAATVLTAANVLHRRFADDLAVCLEVAVAAAHAASRRVPPVVLLALWSAGVITAYRSYPLLVVNALKARAVQRALIAGWTVAIPPGLSSAPSEYGPPLPRPAAEGDHAPSTFDVLDRTLAKISAHLRPGAAIADDSIEMALLLESVASAMARVIVRTGGDKEGEPAVVWATEPRPEHRAIEVFIPPLRMIKSFIAEQPIATLPAVRGKKAADPDSPTYLDPADYVPVLPRGEAWDGLTPSQRRLLIEMYTIAFRWMRESDAFGEENPVGRELVARLGELSTRADRMLEPGDAVRLDAAVAALTSGIRSSVRDGDDLGLGRASEVLDAVSAGLADGSLDAGFGLDLLARGAVVLNRARRNAAGRVDADLLLSKLDTYWSQFDAILLGNVFPAPGPSAAGFHLHNYAGYLGTREHDPVSLAKSIDYFRRYVIPSRTVAARLLPSSASLRLSLQVAARAAMILGGLQADSGALADARGTAIDALQWSADALDTVTGRKLLDEELTPAPEESHYFLAIAVGGSLALADRVELAVAPELRARISRVVERARGWIDADVAHRGDQDTMLQRIEQQLAAARA
jgi:hypothetical protein